MLILLFDKKIAELVKKGSFVKLGEKKYCKSGKGGGQLFLVLF